VEDSSNSITIQNRKPIPINIYGLRDLRSGVLYDIKAEKDYQVILPRYPGTIPKPVVLSFESFPKEMSDKLFVEYSISGQEERRVVAVNMWPLQ